MLNIILWKALLIFFLVDPNYEGDIRIIMFVLLNEGFELNDDLITKIKQILREKTSPRHVPKLIFQTLKFLSY